MFSKITVVIFLTFSFSVNADVVKWVDSQGKTHYSNKAPKQHKNAAQKINFTQYKKPQKIDVVVVPAVDWSKDFTQTETSYQTEVSKSNYKPQKSRQRKPRKVKKLTITELRAQCDIAREKRLAPARAEAIEDCIEKNERQTKNVAAYCERFNRTFGDQQHGGFYVNAHRSYPYVVGGSRQRLFHNIPECRRLYRAEDKRSRLNRGYRD